LGNKFGWPFVEGGSQKIAEALAAYLRKNGGEIVTGKKIVSSEDLPPARVVLCDVTPAQLLEIAGNRLPRGYCRKLQKYRYGPGVFKIDWALAEPVPFRDPVCRQAGTLHLGGSLEKISQSENIVWQGNLPDKPFVIFAQPSLFDPTRAPSGKHTAWAYCHVPNGSVYNMTKPLEKQVERFAEGFRDVILSKHIMNANDLHNYNANYIGGDINGGIQDIRQLFSRPVCGINPYLTPSSGLYICSSSTPPGGGVHGLCGYFAASAALKKNLR
jgi:phytoene dehydrogenase-like protein